MSLNKYIGALGLIGLFLLSGCDLDSELMEKPPHLITAETLYTNTAGFEAGLNGLYERVRLERAGLWNNNTLTVEAFMNGTDNMVTNYPTMNSFGSIAEDWGSVNNSQHNFLDELFKWLYETVNAANTIIVRGEADQGIDWSEAEKNRVLADARAARAWAYRHLTYLWGDVPLSLEEANGSNIRLDWERHPVSQVREQIIEDLLFAEQHIAVEGTMPGRMTKGAVQHYLAEMYLAKEGDDPADIQEALYWTDKVLDNPAYSLIQERYGVRADRPGVVFMDMFHDGNSNRSEGNTEALWVFQYDQFAVGGGLAYMRRFHANRIINWTIDGVNALEVTNERGGRGIGRMVLTKWAIDNYEPRDDRGSNHAIRKYFILKDEQANAPFAADRLPPGYQYGDTLWFDWSGDITVKTRKKTDWPWARKVEGGDPNNIDAMGQWNAQIYLRLAETYLLKAEAQFLLGDIGGAAETLNVIRRRSNASEITAGDVDMDFILDERSRELLAEEHRRHTLLRTGKWLERTKAHNKNGGQLITERDRLLPIPQSVLDANLTKPMPQNPDY